ALQALAEAKKDLDAIPASQRDDAFISVQARTDELCAVTHWTLRDYENAHAAIDRAMRRYESVAKERERFNALNAKAAFYASTGEYAKAIELMLEAEKFFEKIGDRKKRAMLLHNISGIYYESGQEDIGLQTISKAIETLGEEQSRQSIEMFNGRGLMLMRQGRYDEAEADFKRALELSRTYESLDEQVRALSGIGRAYLERERFDEALKVYQEALKLRASARSRNAELDILKGIGYIYERRGEWQRAKAHYEKMLSLAEADRSELHRADAFAGLSRVAEAEGDYKAALEFHKAFHRHSETLAEKKSDDQFQRFKAMFLADQAKKESESLKALNAQLFKAHDALSQIVSELELQKADLELQYSRIKELLSSLSEGILIEDENRKAHFVNQRLLDLFGIKGTPDDFIGKSADRLRAFVRHRVQESDKTRAYFERCFYERRTERGKEVKQLNGKIYEFSFVPLFKQERYRGSLWIFEDVTLRKNRERERELTIEKLNEANQKLQKANRLKDDLIAIAVHDLKNPLNVIIGFSELLLAQSQSESDRAHLESIKRAATRMLALVQDLLNSAKAEKEETLNLAPTSLNQIARYVVANQEVLAKAKRIELRLQENAECKINAEPNKLYEALENLVSNAIKYSPEGKTVFVSVEKLSVERSRMRRKSDLERAKAGVARVVVKDEGQGLTNEDMEKLFQPFQKLSAKPTANEHSTGLGLYIVKNLVEKHHGRVWAESEGKGKGATFFLEFPAIE
ncbi:MAG: tetratricopeptide repeat protein, partial [Chloroherpetonaceae bacterium]|nr:tetratricopeptide repeat protein [Chloroherpetonaceae bacterium]